jgi:hypothetical protein
MRTDAANLIGLVRPKPEAHTVAFFSFGEALYGEPYYDTQSLENVPLIERRAGSAPARTQSFASMDRGP